MPGHLRRSPRYRRLALAAAALVALDVQGAGLPDTVARTKPSVVGIGTMLPTRTPPAELLGTGFIVGDGRHVLTAAHVIPTITGVEKLEYFAVFVGTGADPEVRAAEKVAVDYQYDVALLKIPGPALPALTLGDSDRVREGQYYAFTGFPIAGVLGLYPATHRGIVSAITPIVAPVDRSRQLDAALIARLRSPYSIFQLDATAYPGNSGGPLFDIETGEVMGIVNMVFVKGSKEKALSEPSGISYAIPINPARALLREANVTP